MSMIKLGVKRVFKLLRLLVLHIMRRVVGGKEYYELRRGQHHVE